MQSIQTAPDAPAAAFDKSFLKEAEKLDTKIVNTIDRMGKDVIFLGEAFNEMQDKGFHVALGFPRMEDYIKARWPEQNKSTVFQAMRITRELTGGEKPAVSVEDVRAMSKGNAEALAKLKKGGTPITAQLIESAKTMDAKSFQKDVLMPLIPELAQRQAAANGTHLDTEPEVIVKRSYSLSSQTEAMRVKSFEIFRWLRKERAADEMPEVSELRFEDEALRFIFASFLAEHQAEYEQTMAEREAYTAANAHSFAAVGAVTMAGGDDEDAVAEADEDAEEAIEAIEEDGTEAEDVSHSAPANCTGHKPNGSLCGSPALRGNTLCYFHNREAEKDEAAANADSE
jgi:hypothetical protein